jgi:hypothetical protein
MKDIDFKKRAKGSAKAVSHRKPILGFKDWINKVYEPSKQKQIEWGGKIWTDPVYD